MSWLTPETALLLGRGFILTIVLTAITSLSSLTVGVGVGTLKLTGRPLGARLATVYIELFRNIPALVLIIFLAFALPNLFPESLRKPLFFDNALVNGISRLTGLPLPYYALAAAVALTLNTGAYIAELFRAGVGTLSQSVVDSARSLGGSPRDVFWTILLPQGVRAASPALITRLIHNMKNTALAAFVAVPEFFQATQGAISRTFQALELLLLAAVVYLILAFALGELLRRLTPRLPESGHPPRGWPPGESTHDSA